jgi:hypothetical protein
MGNVCHNTPRKAGLFAYVIIPGLLVIWDRVLDYMGGANGKS